jgi:hypothetical protein
MLYYTIIYAILVVKGPQVTAPHFAKWELLKVKPLPLA